MRLKLIALLALFATPSLAADHAGHAKYHHVYKHWLMPNGASCCNDQDCRPAVSRSTAHGVEVKIDGAWVSVPPDRIRPYSSPDLNDHVCHSGKTIFCFVPGGGV